MNRINVCFANNTLNNYAKKFDLIVECATRKGTDLYIVPFSALQIKKHPTDEDFDNFAAFIETLLDNNYAVEYYYKSPRHSCASGFIAAYGDEGFDKIESFFLTTLGEYYKG